LPAERGIGEDPQAQFGPVAAEIFDNNDHHIHALVAIRLLAQRTGLRIAFGILGSFPA
jgi:hypothetical protein